MASEYLDKTGLTYFWGKLKDYFGDLLNDSGFVESSDLADVATTGDYDDLSNKPTIPTVPTNVSAFTNDAGYLTTETDPTVPSWAKQSTKPSYTASEVGALPDTTSIPSKTSDLTNDSGFLTSHQSIKTVNNNTMTGTGNVTVQETLVSGTNIKTINGTSLLGSGDCAVATYSTTDLTAGSSSLATGRIYLVYE